MSKNKEEYKPEIGKTKKYNKVEVDQESLRIQGREPMDRGNTDMKR
jgi:hypothetical protein